MNTRILIAGFQHETNTFAPSKAAYANFERGEGFPAMVRGDDVLALRDVNIPAGGFIVAAERRGWTLLPVIWAGASPSAHVTEDAFERIAGEILAAVRSGGYDAVYLDLHGAMVAEHTDDGEGTLLERVRAAVGPAVPVVASLDLHANVTAKMLHEADALVAFRTYPHVDMAETGERAAVLLERLLVSRAAGSRPLHRAVRRLPFLIPINGMCTLLEPARGMYAELAALETGAVASLSFAPGFPAADFPECGPVIWGYGDDAASAEAAVQALYDRMLADEAAWQVPFLSPDAAVREAMRLADGAGKPVVIADTQDNPGAGGDSNTTGMLRALLRNGAREAAIGLIWDPAAAAAAHRAGVGAFVELALGGVSGVPGDEPVHARFEVVKLSDGVCRYDGPMMNGMRADIGPVACLRIDGVLIVVSSGKAQMLDRNLYRVGGVEPEAMRILVNKSSVHFRADFQGIAEAVLVATAPGPMTADPAELPWTRLAPGIRMKPMGDAFAGNG
ncbi:microcystin degradation protein MlrC [Burkholderia cepacia]|uniref:M81 family metallopeptidase n=1 Tax=Burkholderia cepacia TaxID=292 RepID=UPI000756EF68|nr:M81 family metallopeptidase [Burkholderia cepacia]KVA50374.1 microcystin degradation protein MlrC [Burkholderia cepacia]KVA54173.1 microcystin degradation protein MlrC [Burkholderia cepacia]KVA63370.1 microcystin degradation protein MlrC [Burkholderia cepacia]KVA81775.1 microcystin degradation protein MlrC [Burkholderia cepacia]KVA90505.1 microcystin degradation protein MlrC [Burkholderia cepacia]